MIRKVGRRSGLNSGKILKDSKIRKIVRKSKSFAGNKGIEKLLSQKEQIKIQRVKARRLTLQANMGRILDKMKIFDKEKRSRIHIKSQTWFENYNSLTKLVSRLDLLQAKAEILFKKLDAANTQKEAAQIKTKIQEYRSIAEKEYVELQSLEKVGAESYFTLKKEFGNEKQAKEFEKIFNTTKKNFEITGSI